MNKKPYKEFIAELSVAALKSYVKAAGRTMRDHARGVKALPDAGRRSAFMKRASDIISSKAISKLDFLVNQYETPILMRALEDKSISRIPVDEGGRKSMVKSIIVNYIDDYTPLDEREATASGHYEFLIKRYLKGEIPLNGSREETNKVKILLSQFDRHKSSLPQKDLNRYKSLDELEQAFKKIDLTILDPKKFYKLLKTGAMKIFVNKKDLKIVQLNTLDAAKFYCQETDWCLTQPTHFNTYAHSKGGKLFIITANLPTKGLTKIGWSLKMYQFLDSNDNRVAEDVLHELTKMPAYAAFVSSIVEQNPFLVLRGARFISQEFLHKLVANNRKIREAVTSSVSNIYRYSLENGDYSPYLYNEMIKKADFKSYEDINRLARYAVTLHKRLPNAIELKIKQLQPEIYNYQYIGHFAE